jgi:hypothetical protein
MGYADPMSGAKVDAALTALLGATDHPEPIEAVFRLKPEQGTVLIEPDVTEEVTRQVIERAEQETGQKAGDRNVFRNLGSFMVSAPAPVIKYILAQPEIAAGLANRQHGEAGIEPVRKSPAQLPGTRRAAPVKRRPASAKASPTTRRRSK